jgi:universal stress protein E
MDARCDVGGEQMLHPDSADNKVFRTCPAPLMVVHPQSKLEPHRLLAAIDVFGVADSDFNDRIVQAAQDIAQLSDAEVGLASTFSILPMEPYTGLVAETYEIMDRGHQEALAAFAAKHQVPPEHVHRMQMVDAAVGVAELASDCGADMVVMGSAYHGAMDRVLFGTTAEGLLRRLHCDVLLVKPEDFLQQLGRHLDLAAIAVEADAAAA